jgi:hypothetical protein
MEARIIRAVLLTAVLASFGAGYRTPNFVVEARSEGLAERVGLAAEKYRRELALLWLDKELPDWNEPCPITVQVAPHLGAGGETSFVFDRGPTGQMEVFGWKMRVQGTEERVLDSVLPHEVTHTILATHFRRPLPRWADEGACTTVEHTSERNKQQNLLITFLRTNKGIAFSNMFAMKEYPSEMLPLYAQGYSLARYLIEQGGRQKFLAFIGEGLKRENWTGATKSYYGYNNLAHLQNSWLDWVKQGSPVLNRAAGQNELLIAQRDRKVDRKTKADPVSLANARFQNDDADRARNDDSRTAPAGRPRPASNALARNEQTLGDRIRRNADISTFEPKSGLGGRDGFGASREIDQLAAADRRDLEIVRSNKQSIYDRGIPASGNAHQYPFKSAANRPTQTGSGLAELGASSQSVAGLGASSQGVAGVGASSRNPGIGAMAEAGTPSQSAASSSRNPGIEEPPSQHTNRQTSSFDTSNHDPRRRVILEWSHDGSHQRDARQPNVDASW